MSQKARQWQIAGWLFFVAGLIGLGSAMTVFSDRPPIWTMSPTVSALNLVVAILFGRRARKLREHTA